MNSQLISNFILGFILISIINMITFIFIKIENFKKFEILKKINLSEKLFQILMVITVFFILFIIFTFDGFIDFEKSISILLLEIFFIIFVLKKLVIRFHKLDNNNKLLLLSILFLFNLVVNKLNFILSFLSLVIIKYFISFTTTSFKLLKVKYFNFKFYLIFFTLNFILSLLILKIFL